MSIYPPAQAVLNVKKAFLKWGLPTPSNFQRTVGCYSTHLGAVAPTFENARSQKVVIVRGPPFMDDFFATKAASASSIQHNTAIPSSWKMYFLKKYSEKNTQNLKKILWESHQLGTWMSPLLINMKKKSKIFFDSQNGFKMILKWFWSKKKFFFSWNIYIYIFSIPEMYFFRKKSVKKSKKVPKT